jgi:hypothetical protein
MVDLPIIPPQYPRIGTRSIAAMATALEQSLIDLCAKHDFHYADIAIHTRADGAAYFRACVQWEGYTNSGNACAMDHGGDIATALNKTLAKAVACRTPPAVTAELADEALPLIGADA